MTEPRRDRGEANREDERIRRLLPTIAIAILAGIAATNAEAHVTRIPHRCESRPAPLLCAIHWHHHRANLIRSRLGLDRIPYQHLAERYPHRRPRLLHYWRRVHAHAIYLWRHRPRTPWSESWQSSAECIHHYEGAWNANTGNGYYGGMQFDLSTWQANGGVGRPDLASPSEQLRIAYRTWQARGWTPWPNTAAMCGLL